MVLVLRPSFENRSIEKRKTNRASLSARTLVHSQQNNVKFKVAVTVFNSFCSTCLATPWQDKISETVAESGIVLNFRNASRKVATYFSSFS